MNFSDVVLVVGSITKDWRMWRPASHTSHVQLVVYAFLFWFGYCGLVWEGLQIQLKRGKKPSLLSEEYSVLIMLQYA